MGRALYRRSARRAADPRRRVGRRQRARLRRQHNRLPPPQGHRGRAGTARARHHRLAGARGRVLHAARDDAAHEPRAPRAAGHAGSARRGAGRTCRYRRSMRLRTPLEVRDAATRDGRYNIPNVGLFLWRLRSYAVGAGRSRRRIARLRERPQTGRVVERPSGRLRLAAVQRSRAPRRRSPISRRRTTFLASCGGLALNAELERLRPGRRGAGSAVHD